MGFLDAYRAELNARKAYAAHVQGNRDSEEGKREEARKKHEQALELYAKDRDGLALDVTMALSASKVKVTALSARSMPDGHAVLNIVVEVSNKEELTSVINRLNNIPGVYHVGRAAGK